MVRDDLRRPEITPFTGEEWSCLGDASRKWVVDAAGRLVELEARLGMNSTNSSKPPSSDPPGIKRFRRPPSGRRPGGQPGHPGRYRPLVPEDRVNQTKDLYPKRCRRCGGKLSKEDADGLEPWRHQVAEIPKIEPDVTEWRHHRACCPDCKTVTMAPFPDGVPEEDFGPNLRALLVTLSARFRMSRREVAEFFDETFGLSISVGSVDNICRRVGEALATPVEEVLKHVQAAPVVHCDESSWRQKGKKHWIWEAVAKLVAYFLIADSRSSKVAREILGQEFQGMLVSDRYAVYSMIPAERRQACWSHLGRDFQGFVDRGGAARPFGERGVALAERLFSIWHAYKREEIGRRTMQKRMAPVEKDVGDLLGEGYWSEDQKTQGFCKNLMDLEPALFLFVRVPGVEPTNNLAERTVRPAVLWRKGSFGTQSEAGSRFVGRMMTVVMTRRLQKLSVLKYLQEVFAAMDRGDRIPSLLPKKARDRPENGKAASPRAAERRRAG